MNVNSTKSCASNERVQNNQPKGAPHPSMAGTDRRSTAADHRWNRLSLQPAAGTEHRCLLANQAAHRKVRMAQPSARVPNPAGNSHHCCDRVWADDAAQASPYDRELISPRPPTPRKCSRRSHCHGMARGWDGRWHRPLNRNSGHREQQPGTPAPHRCNADRHREQQEPSQQINQLLYRPKKDDHRANTPFPHTIHTKRLTMILT